MRDWLLGSSVGYRTFRRVIGADRHMAIVANDYVRASEGHRVLDVGCGNGDLARMLPPDAVYVGLDHNPSYVRSARQRRLDVVEADVASLPSLGHAPFDTVVAIGVLHHLDDREVEGLLADCRSALVPGGRLITVDPVLHPGQSRISRGLMAIDRGKHIRDEGHYRTLFDVAGDAHSTVRHDLVRFPYAHCIMQCAV